MIHPKHLQRIETAKANVTITTLVALAMAYKVPLRSFFTAKQEAIDPEACDRVRALSDHRLRLVNHTGHYLDVGLTALEAGCEGPHTNCFVMDRVA